MINLLAGSRRKISLVLVITMLFLTLSACDEAGSNGNNGNSGNSPATEDSQQNSDYSDYIHSALESVGSASATPTPEPVKDEGRVIQVVTDSNVPQDVQVSASEGLPESSGQSASFDSNGSSASSSSSSSSSAAVSSDSQDELSSSSEGDGKPVTPDEFDVGVCCIYVNGEIDDKYGEELIEAFNKARTDLGYPALNEKKGLDTCANRRTREISTYFRHMRPNATPFYSLAPQYFKAELLAVDGAKAPDTVEAWIRDPVSRTLVFTTKYTSIGAACFKCNGLNCIVVALGD